MRLPFDKALVVVGAALELALAVLLGFTFREARETMRLSALASFRTNLVVNQMAQRLPARRAPLIGDTSATLLFVGDLMLARGVEFYTEREGSGDFRFPFARASSTLRSADFTVGNLEHPISDRGRDQGSRYSLRAKPEAARALAEAGFDVVSLANNHIWDWGADALADTIAHLDAVGIRHVGAGMDEAEANRPLVVEVKGQSVAFLAWTNLYPEGLEARGANPGVSRFRDTEATQQIRALASQYDLVVVLFHWGDEYQTRSSQAQQRIAQALINAGADLVIGHHPHVAQEIEQIGEGWVFYSLGNFVFDQGFSEETMRGLALRVTVADGRVTALEVLRTQMNEYFQPAFIEY